MRHYVHWLKVDEMRHPKDEVKQYREISRYLAKYPESDAELFVYEYQLFNKVVKLTCNQNWDELDMMVNSGSNSLKRLSQKPKDIFSIGEFKVPSYLQVN